MKKIIICIISLLTIILVIYGFNYIKSDDYKYQNLGYSKEEISLIRKLNKTNQKFLSKNYVKNIAKFINDDNFLEENIERYYDFYLSNDIEIDKIIYLVNNNYDNIDSFVYDEVIFSFIKNKYFILENADRYIAYYEKNNKTIDEAIKEVNVNLDYEYYTNVKKSDTSKGNLILVNKYNYLDKNYVPDDLVDIDSFYGVGQIKKEVYEAFKKLSDDADLEGYNIGIYSAYRSYDTQEYLFNYYVSIDGIDEANTYSAHPGYSEHQTGLAIDITTYKNNKMDYTWILENCYKYGFILRYSKEYENITGYMYEPWHFRYVGVEVANKIKELNITYDEYYAYYIENM